MTIDTDVGQSDQGVVSRLGDRGFGELVESVESGNVDDGGSFGFSGAEEERGLGVLVGGKFEAKVVGRSVDLGGERTRRVIDGRVGGGDVDLGSRRLVIREELKVGSLCLNALITFSLRSVCNSLDRFESYTCLEMIDPDFYDIVGRT